MTVKGRLRQYLYSGVSQGLSLFSAVLLSGTVLLFPNALAAGDEGLSHGVLSLCMLGISAGFVFGVGFLPRNKILSWLLGPCLAWPLMVFSYVLILGII